MMIPRRLRSEVGNVPIEEAYSMARQTYKLGTIGGVVLRRFSSDRRARIKNADF